MVFVNGDRTKETTDVVGTGTADLLGAATGFRTFVDGIGTSNTCTYVIVDTATGDWEIGTGTVTDAAPDTLSRDSVTKSSNSDALVSFSAGTKIVFNDIDAATFDLKLDNIVEDLTPQAGGDFDMNGNQMQWSKGADVASATALVLLTDGNYFDVTGTTTITSFNTTGGAGTVIKLHFDGILTLTHHATDLILPGAANITTAAGDEFEFTEYAAGDYRCTGYALASGSAVVGGGGGVDLFADNYISGTLPSAAGTESVAIGENASVASGADDGIACGRNATIGSTGYRALCFGYNTTISGPESFIFGGDGNNASGGCFIGGGNNNTLKGNAGAIGSRLIVEGTNLDNKATYSAYAGAYGATVVSTNGEQHVEHSIISGYYPVARRTRNILQGNKLATNGDCQGTTFVMRQSTTTATTTTMVIGANNPDYGENKMPIHNDSTIAFDIVISARRTDADNESAGWVVQGVIDNNAGTVALVGTPTVTSIGDDSAGTWTVAIVANDGANHKCLDINVTGEASKTILWTAFIRTAESTG